MISTLSLNIFNLEMKLCLYRFYLVSRLLNFFVLTLPGSKPSREQIKFVNSGCDDPPNTFILGILERNDGRCSNIDGDK